MMPAKSAPTSTCQSVTNQAPHTKNWRNIMMERRAAAEDLADMDEMGEVSRIWLADIPADGRLRGKQKDGTALP